MSSTAIRALYSIVLLFAARGAAAEVNRCSSSECVQADGMVDGEVGDATSLYQMSKILSTHKTPLQPQDGSLSLMQLNVGSESTASAWLNTVRTMALNAVEGKGSDASEDTLKAIVTLMDDTVIKNAFTEKDTNQGFVTRDGKTAIDTCATTKNTAFTESGGVNDLKKGATDANGTHFQCREDQAGANATWKAKCGAFDTFAAALAIPKDSDGTNCCPFPPAADRDGQEKCLAKLVEWSEANKAEFATKDGECTGSLNALTSKKATCDANQGAYQTAFCTYKTTVTQVCKTYGQCRGIAGTTYEDTKTRVKVAETAFKAEYKSAKKVICYVEVLKKMANGEAVEKDTSKQAFNVCDRTAVDDSVLDIDYITPADALPCEKSYADNSCATFYTWNYAAAPVVACTDC